MPLAFANFLSVGLAWQEIKSGEAKKRSDRRRLRPEIPKIEIEITHYGDPVETIWASRPSALECSDSNSVRISVSVRRACDL